jgi:hypothetical protein
MHYKHSPLCAALCVNMVYRPILIRKHFGDHFIRTERCNSVSEGHEYSDYSRFEFVFIFSLHVHLMQIKLFLRSQSTV